jgi:hypothetical protein
MTYVRRQILSNGVYAQRWYPSAEVVVNASMMLPNEWLDTAQHKSLIPDEFLSNIQKLSFLSDESLSNKQNISILGDEFTSRISRSSELSTEFGGTSLFTVPALLPIEFISTLNKISVIANEYKSGFISSNVLSNEILKSIRETSLLESEFISGIIKQSLLTGEFISSPRMTNLISSEWNRFFQKEGTLNNEFLLGVRSTEILSSELVSFLLRVSYLPFEFSGTFAPINVISAFLALEWLSALIPTITVIAPPTDYVVLMPAKGASVVRLPDFPAIDTYNTKTLAADYGEYLPSGVQLTGTPNVSLSVSSGRDPAPQDRIVFGPLITTAPVSEGGSGLPNTAVEFQIQPSPANGSIVYIVTFSNLMRTDGTDIESGYCRLPVNAPN